MSFLCDDWGELNMIAYIVISGILLNITKPGSPNDCMGCSPAALLSMAFHRISGSRHPFDREHGDEAAGDNRILQSRSFISRMSLGNNGATDAVTQQLSAAQSAAHSFRLKVSGATLAAGALLFCLGQIFLILHNNDYQPLGNFGPPIFAVSNLLGQAVMLLALQPSDKVFGMMAAILLATLCLYMVSSFPYTTIFQLEPIEATRHWIYLALELIFGTGFGIALIRRPGICKLANRQRWLFTPRARIMFLWWLWRLSAASFSLLEIGTTIALVVDHKAPVPTAIVTLRATGDVSEYTPTILGAISAKFAVLAGVEADAVVVTVTAGSVILTVQIQAPTVAAVDTIVANVAATLSDANAATAFLADVPGITINVTAPVVVARCAAADPEPESAPNGEPQAAVEAEPEAAAAAEPEAEAEPAAEADAEPQAAAEPEAEAEPAAEADAEPQAAAEPEAEAEPAAEADAEPQAAAEPEAVPEAVPCLYSRRRLVTIAWLVRPVAFPLSVGSLGVRPLRAAHTAENGFRRMQEPEAEPLIDPSDQGAVVLSLVCNCLVILIAVLATRRRRRRVHAYLSRCGARMWSVACARARARAQACACAHGDPLRHPARAAVLALAHALVASVTLPLAHARSPARQARPAGRGPCRRDRVGVPGRHQPAECDQAGGGLIPWASFFGAARGGPARRARERARGWRLARGALAALRPRQHRQLRKPLVERRG